MHGYPVLVDLVGIANLIQIRSQSSHFLHTNLPLGSLNSPIPVKDPDYPIFHIHFCEQNVKGLPQATGSASLTSGLRLSLS